MAWMRVLPGWRRVLLAGRIKVPMGWAPCSPWRAGSTPPNHPSLRQGQGVAQDGGAGHPRRLLPGWWLELHIPVLPGHRGDTGTAGVSQHGVTGTRGVPSCLWAPISSQAPLSPWGPSRPCTRGPFLCPPCPGAVCHPPAPTSTRPHHRRAAGRTGRRQGVRGREQHPPQGGRDPPRHPSLCPGRGPPEVPRQTWDPRVRKVRGAALCPRPGWGSWAAAGCPHPGLAGPPAM